MTKWIQELHELEAMTTLTSGQLRRWEELSQLVAVKQQQEGYVFV